MTDEPEPDEDDRALPPGMITITVHQHNLDQPCPAWCTHAGTEHDRAQENPMPEQPERRDALTHRPLAERARAASKTAEVDKLLEHAEAGAYARSVLTEQLEAARLERDGTLDMMETYQEQFDAEQLRVQQLELAIADLDAAAGAALEAKETAIRADDQHECDGGCRR
jgi:hypothetical protein